MPRPRSRRTVLALSASALLSLAGCTSGGRRKTDDRTTRAVCTDESAIETTTTTETATTDPTRNATEESNEGHEHYRYVQIIVQGVTPVHVANEIVQQFSDLSQLQQQVVSEAVANGAYVLSEEGRSVEPFESVAFVAYDGDYTASKPLRERPH